MFRNASGGPWRRIAVIGGLSAAAFSGPILDLYGRNPDVWVANRSSSTQMILFGIGVVLLIPALFILLSLVVGALSERADRYLYIGSVALLSIAIGFVVSRQIIPSHTKWALVLTLAIAGVVTWLVLNAEGIVALSAIAVPVLLAIFLIWSQTASLMWSGPEPVGAADTVGSPHSVLMIQLDELPLASLMSQGGTINADLFPNLARLADRSTWYRNALADSIATSQSVPAILSGRTGEETGEGSSFATRPNNLFTLLGESYDMHVIEWVTELCPEYLCPEFAGRQPISFVNVVKDVGVVYGHLTLPNWGRERLPAIDTAWTGFLGATETASPEDVEIRSLPVAPEPDRDDWLSWMQRISNGISPGGPPTLSFAHLGTPHVPWNVNPSGSQYLKPEEHLDVQGVDGDGRWNATGHQNVVGLQRHLFELGAFDAMLGQMIDHIDRLDAWDDIMFVVIADHGASFQAGQHRRWPFLDNRDDLYRIPLFIKYPGQQEGVIDDRAVFGVDVVPTIVDVLDIATDWTFDGTSLVTLDEEREHQPRRWCCNGAGVSTDLATLFAQVESGYEVIPHREDWTGVVAADVEFGDLLGQPVSAELRSQRAKFTWTVDLGPLSGVDRSAGFVQTLVSGRLDLEEAPPDGALAVVLNDVFAGVAWVSPSGEEFYGLVAEDLVRDGTNDFELLVPDGRGGWMSGSERLSDAES